MTETQVYITATDIITLFGMVIMLPFIAAIIIWALNFIPEFMRSVVKSVKNPNLIYDKENLSDPSLDASELGEKTFSFERTGMNGNNDVAKR